MRFPTIDAILFDMGRTLRHTVKDPVAQEEWLKKTYYPSLAYPVQRPNSPNC